APAAEPARDDEAARQSSVREHGSRLDADARHLARRHRAPHARGRGVAQRCAATRGARGTGRPRRPVRRLRLAPEEATMSTPFNLAAIQEAIAERIPERECIVYRDRRISWGAFTDRTRRLANFLRSRGLGCRTERHALRNCESGQDHVGLYLYNCNEYLEGMMGAFKARVAPFNVNYRYVENELVYLLDNAEATALVYHARFAPTLANILAKLPRLRTLLQVADESGNALLPGAVDYEEALAGADASCPDVGWSADDLYILYTGGTTGMPKGVLWRQEDIFFGALGGNLQGGTRIGSIESLAEVAAHGRMLRSLPAPPFMHGAAHW